MKTMLKFFLENSPYSMMRLISFAAVGIGMLVVIIAVISCFTGLNREYVSELVHLCIIVLGFGFGGKLTQKIVEKENEKSEELKVNPDTHTLSGRKERGVKN